jgi:hypothetical protein
MNEPELRAMVRDVIARHAGASLGRGAAGPSSQMVSPGRGHASHAMFVLPAGADGEGVCLIEPAVTCNHCGYCKSWGH